MTLAGRFTKKQDFKVAPDQGHGWVDLIDKRIHATHLHYHFRLW
jgi:hypothetical protein